jgi:hypothetical protein
MATNLRFCKWWGLFEELTIGSQAPFICLKNGSETCFGNKITNSLHEKLRTAKLILNMKFYNNARQDDKTLQECLSPPPFLTNK